MSADIRIVDAPDLLPDTPRVWSFAELCDAHPQLNQPIVDGLLRRGEVANVIAGPKVGKSYLAAGLAWSVAAGRPWLGRDTACGTVCIVDNELHPPTLRQRLCAVRDAMRLTAEVEKRLFVVSLRGRSLDIENLSQFIDLPPCDLVICDALYRLLPAGASENDNASMMRVYNALDRLAASWDAAVVCVHHASKGGQGGKSITDVGSGAGSISRAADCHIVLREHETEGLIVLEAVARSWSPPEPKTVRFDYPLWSCIDVEPAVKHAKSGKELRQEALDAEADKLVLDATCAEALTRRQVQTASGMGPARVDRAIDRLKQSGKLIELDDHSSGERITTYYAPPERGCTPPCTVWNPHTL
jgi:hypothetical protein